MMPTVSDDETETMLELQAAANALGVHYQTAYRWVRSGRLAAELVVPRPLGRLPSPAEPCEGAALPAAEPSAGLPLTCPAPDDPLAG